MAHLHVTLLFFIGFTCLVFGQIFVENVKVSNRRVSSNNVNNIANTDNIDFDTAITDNTNWWRSDDKSWIVGDEGLYELSAVITFDQSNIAILPTSAIYDHQIHVILNSGFPTTLFLDVFTTKGDGTSTWQQKLSGTATYSLSVGDEIALRIQTRVYPTTIGNSSIDGGLFGLSQATLRYLGKL